MFSIVNHQALDYPIDVPLGRPSASLAVFSWRGLHSLDFAQIEV